VQKYQDFLPDVAWLDADTGQLLPWWIVMVGAALLAVGWMWLRRVKQVDS